MRTDDNPTPVKDPHVAFARELVALARKHGADALTVSFRLSGSMLHRRYNEGESLEDWTQVSFTWAEGRHGAPSRFGLRAEAHVSLTEPENPHG